MTNEAAFFFESGKHRLFGVLHDAEKAKRGAGYVFCYPFAEERLWAQRVYVDLARELARRGYPVLRFDYTGNGDSEGWFEDADVETWLSDIGCAMRTLMGRAQGMEGVGLVGLRFGATLAALAAERYGVSALVLWEPIIDGSQYMQEVLRSNLVTQSAIFKEIRRDRKMLVQDLMEGKFVNVDGYEIGKTLYEGISGIRLSERVGTCANRCLIVQIDGRGGPIREKFHDLGRCFPRSSIVGVFEEPFWKEIKKYNGKAENLCRATLEWLEPSDG